MGFMDKYIRLCYLNKNGLVCDRVIGNLSQPSLHYHVQLFLLFVWNFKRLLSHLNSNIQNLPTTKNHQNEDKSKNYSQMFTGLVRGERF